MLAAVLVARLSTSLVNQDLAHGLGRRGEEVPSAVPALGFASHQAKIGFVHKRGGLKGVARRCFGHPGLGQPAQLFIDQRKQLGTGPRVARTRGVQQLSHWTGLVIFHWNSFFVVGPGLPFSNWSSAALQPRDTHYMPRPRRRGAVCAAYQAPRRDEEPKGDAMMRANWNALVILSVLATPVALGQRAAVGPGETSRLVENTFDPNGAQDNAGVVKDPGAEVPVESVPLPASGGGVGLQAGATPPASDTCQSATVIPGNVVTYNPALLNTTGATVTSCDGLESCEAGNVGISNSVWYIYNPDANGTVVINTFGSTYNTVLSVFSGGCGFLLGSVCLGVPTQVACNDDYPFGTTSQIAMAVVAGRNYRIKVSDYNTTDGGGLLDFNLYWFPPNDVCADATEVHGISYNPPPIGTQNAVVDLCENQESCEVNNVGTSNTVWYSYTPPCDGFLSVNTNGSNYDTVLSIWDKCGVFAGVDFPCNFGDTAPMEIACDDDSGTGTQSQLTDIPVTGGQAYLIKAADYNTSIGGGLLSFNLLFAGADPPIAAITAPTDLACVCGEVDVVGTATAGNGILDRTLEYRESSDATWTPISIGNSPITDGTLGSWDTTGLPQGHYFLRLTVQNTCGFVETGVTAVFVDGQFDDLEVRRPNDGDIVAGITCVDGTVWDRCFDAYTVMYRPQGGGAYTPVEATNPTYGSTVLNDPLAGSGWDTMVLSDGDYDLRVQSLDLCGHSAEIVRTVTVDNTPPTAVIKVPLSCTTLEGVVEIQGTANDAAFDHWVLQYTGGNEDHWVSIAVGNTPVDNGLLAEWDTSMLEPCAHTLRLLVYSHSIVHCDDPQRSEYLVSVEVGGLCPVDLNGDGVQNLHDYAKFQNCFAGP